VNLDILNLQWPEGDRDLHITIPPLMYLHKKYQLKIETKSIFSGYYYLLKYKPKVLIISYFGGAYINHSISKMAYIMGIKVISFVSEGNRLEHGDFGFWGHNIDKILYLDALLVWSTRFNNFHLNENNLHMQDDKLKVVGAVGFDRYALLDFKSKEYFLNAHNLNYKKIIGIGAWAFDLFFDDYFETYKEHLQTIYTQKQIDMHRKDLYTLRMILSQLIKNNQDILFILRYHPGSVILNKTELFGLDSYTNTFVSSKDMHTNYAISDLINISDIWIGYETTTALEAWLLNKQTFLINPTNSNFVRENVYKGSPIVQTVDEAQNLIDEYFNKGKMRVFESLNGERQKIIKEVIEYDDGKNYIRAANEIMKVYEQPNKKIKYKLEFYPAMLKQFTKLVLSKLFIKKRWPELNYKSDFAKYYKVIYDKVINV